MGHVQASALSNWDHPALCSQVLQVERIKPLRRSGGRSRCSLLASSFPSFPLERTVAWPLGTSIETPLAEGRKGLSVCGGR
jgi:hypothetical protein